jgi:hypothetical protein
MGSELQHGSPQQNGGFERQDLQPRGVIYFLLGLGIATVICLFVLKGVYGFLDQRERALQPPVSPLITNAPEDTRHIAPAYPETAFPNPRLEENERDQLSGFLTKEEQTLYSYGWVDEKEGIVRIPIERAMDLIVERGLPVRPGDNASQSANGNGGNNKTGKGTASSRAEKTSK